MLVVEIAYHMRKAEEKKKHVKLRVDMFILTFAIYGIMIILALLVFLLELKFGKRPVTQENNEGAKDEKSVAQDELDNQPTIVQETPQDPDEINVIEIS